MTTPTTVSSVLPVVHECLRNVLPRELTKGLKPSALVDTLSQWGAFNLAHLVARLRNREKDFTQELGDLKDAQRALENPAHSFRAESKPKPVKFIRITPSSELEGSLTRLPDEKTFLTRKKGDTDYALCGWCCQRGSGSYRYDTMLYGDCLVLSAVGSPMDQEVRCDSTCVLRAWTDAEVGQAKELLEQRIARLKQQRDAVRNAIATVREVAQTAPYRPAFPSWRGAAPFTAGDRVVVFTPKVPHAQDAELAPWVVGRVEGQPGSQVLVKMWVKLTASELLEGRGLRASAYDPSLLSVREFEELRAMANSSAAKDKAFMAAWLAAAQADSRYFEEAEFLEALQHGSVRTR